MLQYEARVFAAFLQAALEYAVLQQIEAGLDRIDPRSIKLRILVLPGVCCRTRDLNDARSTTRRTSQCELLEKEFLVFRNCRGVRATCSLSGLRSFTQTGPPDAVLGVIVFCELFPRSMTNSFPVSPPSTSSAMCLYLDLIART